MSKQFVVFPEIADGEDNSLPLANRIKKNYKHVRKWAKRTNTNCFRIYDRELPDYPLAIDYYDGRYCIHYFAAAHEGEEPPQYLTDEAIKALKLLFRVPEEAIYWRTRSKVKETRQYEKAGESKEFFTVLEYGVKFKVNLTDYLDTGLFLDHRETRRIVASQAKGKRLLNLFAYTSSFSVHAAVCGASYTKSIDLSNTYTAWGKDNFLLNDISLDNHDVIRADCLKFMDEEVASGVKYDIVVIDPPTISRSKKMDEMFDIQIHYVELISKALKMLFPGGVIFFSTNSRRFVFNENYFRGCQIKEISYKTLPIDFHDPKIHRCWQIVK